MKQEEILQALQQGEYLSGEALSRRLGVSRAAVWKQIQALREAGYTIEARTKLGYRLLSAPDTLTEAELKSRLPGRSAPLFCFAQIDSTNSYLKQHAGEGLPDGTAVLADCQTGGRGRRGRSFLSPPGKGIYLSVLWRPGLPAGDILPLTALGAVAVCSAIENVCSVRPGIKWTNDLVLGGKKLCGILTEMSLEGESGCVESVIMGIGVNVSQTATDFPPELSSIATSLQQQLHAPVSRPALAAEILRQLDALRTRLGGDLSGDLAAYRRDCVTLGKEVQLLWKDSREEVLALDVDQQFGLVVRHRNGQLETIRSGEVSVRGLYGYLS